MDSINKSHILNPLAKPWPKTRLVTTPCPKSPTGLHGNYFVTPDPDDELELHHWVECGYCLRQASGGVDLKTGMLELFYGPFVSIWQDDDNNYYSHDKLPVTQPDGEEWCLP